MIIEVLLITVVVANTVGGAVFVWWFTRKAGEAFSAAATVQGQAIKAVLQDKKELMSLLRECQNRIQAQSINDYHSLQAAQAPMPKDYDRSDRGEAQIAAMRGEGNGM